MDFKLRYVRKSFFLLFILLSLNHSSLTNASEQELIGHIIIAKGDLKAYQTEQDQPRVLKRRSPIFIGDTLVTGPQSEAQIRFNDKGLLSLKPNSKFIVKNYKKNNVPQESKPEVLMELVKGGFRTITGTLGKNHENAYRVNTPGSSIGIRGTHYEVLHLKSSSTLMAVWQGSISVSTEKGSIDLGDGAEFDFVEIKAGESPKGLLSAPAEIRSETGLRSKQDQKNETQQRKNNQHSQAKNTETPSGSDGKNSKNSSNPTSTPSAKPSISNETLAMEPVSNLSLQQDHETDTSLPNENPFIQTQTDRSLESQDNDQILNTLNNTQIEEDVDDINIDLLNADNNTDNTIDDSNNDGDNHTGNDSNTGNDTDGDSDTTQPPTTEQNDIRLAGLSETPSSPGILVQSTPSISGSSTIKFEGNIFLKENSDFSMVSKERFFHTNGSQYASYVIQKDSFQDSFFDPDVNDLGIVSWGTWAESTTTPARLYTDPFSLETFSVISQPSLFVSANPAPTQNFKGRIFFDDTVNFHIASSHLPTNNLDVDLKVNFDTGKIEEGIMLLSGEEFQWLMWFDGFIEGAEIMSNIKFSEYSDSTTGIATIHDEVEGIFGGLFSGSGALSHFVGYFNLQNSSESHSVSGAFLNASNYHTLADPRLLNIESLALSRYAFLALDSSTLGNNTFTHIIPQGYTHAHDQGYLTILNEDTPILNFLPPKQTIEPSSSLETSDVENNVADLNVSWGRWNQTASGVSNMIIKEDTETGVVTFERNIASIFASASPRSSFCFQQSVRWYLLV